MSTTERKLFKFFKIAVYWLCAIFNKHQHPNDK